MRSGAAGRGSRSLSRYGYACFLCSAGCQCFWTNGVRVIARACTVVNSRPRGDRRRIQPSATEAQTGCRGDRRRCAPTVAARLPLRQRHVAVLAALRWCEHECVAEPLDLAAHMHDAAQEVDVVHRPGRTLPPGAGPATGRLWPAPGSAQGAPPGRPETRPAVHGTTLRSPGPGAPGHSGPSMGWWGDQPVIDGRVHDHRQRGQHPGRRRSRPAAATHPCLDSRGARGQLAERLVAESRVDVKAQPPLLAVAGRLVERLRPEPPVRVPAQCHPARGRLSRVPWNFGGGPLIIRLPSDPHSGLRR